jgi:transcriptional regulator with XRE-family HTH domain
MLSEYLHRVMKQKNLSIADVERNSAKQITAGYIGKILQGTVKNLTVEKILALAKGLEVDPYDIFAASYGRPPGKQTSPDAFALVDLMQKLLLNPDVLEALPMVLKLKPKDRKVLFQPLKFADRKKPKKKKNS